MKTFNEFCTTQKEVNSWTHWTVIFQDTLKHLEHCKPLLNHSTQELVEKVQQDIKQRMQETQSVWVQPT